MIRCGSHSNSSLVLSSASHHTFNNVDQLVSIQLMGGLGNQLFQVFTAMAYALDQSARCIFPYSDKLVVGLERPTYWNNIFQYIKCQTTFENPDMASNILLFPTYDEKGFNYYRIPPLSSFSLNSPHQLKLNGYFQSYKYFEHKLSNITNSLYLSKLLGDILTSYGDYQLCTSKRQLNIAMHFRLGDYKQKQDFHSILQLSYYEKAIRSVTQNLSRVYPGKSIKVYYFCERDDHDFVYDSRILPLKRVFGTIEFEYVADSIPDWHQLLLMSLCHAVIIANSTFSWWAAYLRQHLRTIFFDTNDKSSDYEHISLCHWNDRDRNGNHVDVNNLIAYPSLWFSRTSKLGQSELIDFFPPGWIRIKTDELKVNFVKWEEKYRTKRSFVASGPLSSVVNSLQHVYCIKLSNRADAMKDEFRRMNINAKFVPVTKLNHIGSNSSSDLLRQSSVRRPATAIGTCFEDEYCVKAISQTKAHLDLLKYARSRSQPYIIIFEDNFQFLLSSSDRLYEIMHNFPDDYDVVMLSYNIQKGEAFNSIFGRVIKAESSSGYAVNQKFYDALIERLSEGCMLMENQPNRAKFYSIDNYWKDLQPISRWYYTLHRVGFKVRHDDGDYFDSKLVTVTTAYWSLQNHKYVSAMLPNFYEDKLDNLFSCVQSSMVIYGGIADIEMIKRYRSIVDPNQIKTAYHVVDIWDSNNHSVLTNISREIFEAQHNIDPEKRIHNAELYAIWNAKSALLNQTASINPFASKYHFWVDAGSFREYDTCHGNAFAKGNTPPIHWPNSGIVRNVFSSSNSNKMLLGLVNQYPREPSDELTYNDYIEGGFFGGSVGAVQRWTKRYYELMHDWIERGKFIGKDQVLMNKIAFDNPSEVLMIEVYKYTEGDPWFYFQQYFAYQNESRNPELHRLPILSV